MLAHSSGGGQVGKVVAAGELGGYLGAVRAEAQHQSRAGGEQRGGKSVDRAWVGEAGGHDGCLFYHFEVERIDESRAAGGGQKLKQLALANGHAFDPTEALQMRLADVGEQAVGGAGVVAVAGDFALMVGPHFDDRNFVFVQPQTQQRKRHPDVIVEVADGGQHPKLPGQHGRQ